MQGLDLTALMLPAQQHARLCQVVNGLIHGLAPAIIAHHQTIAIIRSGRFHVPMQLMSRLVWPAVGPGRVGLVQFWKTLTRQQWNRKKT